MEAISVPTTCTQQSEEICVSLLAEFDGDGRKLSDPIDAKKIGDIELFRIERQRPTFNLIVANVMRVVCAPWEATPV